MNQRVIDFYKNHRDRQVIALHESLEEGLQVWLEKAPNLSKGWWELSQMSSPDRLEFISAFWHLKMPYSPEVQEFVDDFFAQVEEVGIYLVKRKTEVHYEPELVYSMKNQKSFYRGAVSADATSLSTIYPLLGQRLSEEYVAFLKVHNGFAKEEERGLIPIEKMGEETYRMQSELMSGFYRMKFEGETLNPRHLIPFYARDEKRFYQCFHTQWYPDGDVGTVGLSLTEREQGCLVMSATRPSFVSWLKHYLGAKDV